MQKHFLTYQFVVAFDQACKVAKIAPEVKVRLIESSEKLLYHFSQAMGTTSRDSEAKNYFVSLLCLRDCREILDESGIKIEEIEYRYDFLHKRVEDLCLKSAKPSNVKPVPKTA